MGKRCVWSADGEEKGDKPSCSLLARVPKVQRTGDLINDQTKTTRRNAYNYILQTLWESPQHTLSVQGHLQSLLAATGTGGDDEKFASISTLGKLEVAWLAGIAAELAGLSKSDLETALGYDEDALKQMVQFLLVAPMSLKLPPECLYRGVMRKIFMQRHAAAGERAAILKKHKTKLFMATGKMNWAVVGVYRLDFSGDRAHKITHQPSGLTVDIQSHCLINRDYIMTANWSDQAASCSLGASRFVLKDFFEKGVGPNATAAWNGNVKKLKIDAEKELRAHHERVEALKGRTNNLEEDFSNFSAPSKRDGGAAAARARAALQKRKTELQHKRQDKIQDVAPPPLEDLGPPPIAASGSETG